MGISRLDRIGGPHGGIDKDFALSLAKAGRDVAFIDAEGRPVLYSPWMRSSGDLNLLFTLDPASDTPNMRIDIWVDYQLIRLATALKKILFKQATKPKGIRLGILWAVDSLVSAVLRPLALVTKIMAVSFLSVHPLIKTVWNLFFRMPFKGRVTKGFKNGLVGLVPLADLLIKPVVRFAVKYPYMTTALVLGAASLFIPVVSAAVFPFAEQALNFLAQTAYPVAVEAIKFGLSGKVVELTAGNILAGLFVLGAGLVGVGKYLSGQYERHESPAKTMYEEELEEDAETSLLDQIQKAKRYQHAVPNTVPRSPQLINQIKQSLDAHFAAEPEKAARYLAAVKEIGEHDNLKIRRKDKHPLIDHSLVKMSGQHFLFDKTLGKGYCGTAKKALHLETGETVVMKITKPSDPILVPVIEKIAANESRILEYLNKGPILSWQKDLDLDSFEPHSLTNTANLTRAVLCHSKIYMTQPFEKGVPVESYVNDNRLTIDDVYLFIYRALLALKNLHDRRVFHGDIKLENLLYNEKGERAAFIDFGLGEITDEHGQIVKPALVVPQPKANMALRQIVGEFHQQSPEWINGKVLGLNTDIFAMGKALEDFLKKAKIEGSEEEVKGFTWQIKNDLIAPMIRSDQGSRPEAGALLVNPLFKQRGKLAVAI